MEEGTRTKKTVFIGGISDDVDESTIYENFSTFGAAQSVFFDHVMDIKQIPQVI
jgi:RNA recognition motif-containing protein